jgi:hypothetical protein
MATFRSPWIQWPPAASPVLSPGGLRIADRTVIAKVAGDPAYRRTGVPAYRRTGVPAYRRTGVPAYRRTGVPASGVRRPASGVRRPASGVRRHVRPCRTPEGPMLLSYGHSIRTTQGSLRSA